MGNSIKTESPSQVLDFIPEKFEIGPKVAYRLLNFHFNLYFDHLGLCLSKFANGKLVLKMQYN